MIKVDGIYHMYFNGQAVGDQTFLYYDIGHAWSTDGKVWNLEPTPVLTRGADGEWDDTSLWGIAVIYDESEFKFKMWYCGLDGELKRAGYATNTDGFGVWAKHPDPVITVGPPGSWDATEVKPSEVIFRDGLYRMFYAGASAWNGPPAGYDWKIGYAESADGVNWNKRSEPVLGPGVGWESDYVYGPSVLYDDGMYHMWYSGGNGSSLDIGYAVSSDGVDWTRHEGNPVVASLPDEGYHLGSVLVDDTGLFEMWYNDVLPDTVRLASSDRHAVFIFVNGFETGDTSAWSAVVP